MNVDHHLYNVMLDYAVIYKLTYICDKCKLYIISLHSIEESFLLFSMRCYITRAFFQFVVASIHFCLMIVYYAKYIVFKYFISVTRVGQIVNVYVHLWFEIKQLSDRLGFDSDCVISYTTA